MANATATKVRDMIAVRKAEAAKKASVPKSKAPAKKAASKSTTKKGTAKKATAAKPKPKNVVPAKKSAAKKAPAKKAAPKKAAPKKKAVAKKAAASTRSATPATRTRRASVAPKTTTQILAAATAASNQTAEKMREASNYVEALDRTSDPLVRARILAAVPDECKKHMPDYFDADGNSTSGTPTAPGTPASGAVPTGSVKIVDKDGRESIVTDADYEDVKEHVAKVLAAGFVKLPDGTRLPRSDFDADRARYLRSTTATTSGGGIGGLLAKFKKPL